MMTFLQGDHFEMHKSNFYPWTFPLLLALVGVPTEIKGVEGGGVPLSLSYKYWGIVAIALNPDYGIVPMVFSKFNVSVLNQS